jgi:hypothetical protein
MQVTRWPFLGLMVASLTMPAAAQDLQSSDIVQIPIRGVDGQQIMMPLPVGRISAPKGLEVTSSAGNQISAPQSFHRSYAGYGWSFFPTADASERIVFTKHATQSWTALGKD